MPQQEVWGASGEGLLFKEWFLARLGPIIANQQLSFLYQSGNDEPYMLGNNCLWSGLCYQ